MERERLECVQMEKFRKIGRHGFEEVQIFRTLIETPKARFAMQLMDKAMVAAERGPEDSAGRASMRPCNPAEAVERACTMAELAYAEFAKRGWLMALPDLSDDAEGGAA